MDNICRLAVIMTHLRDPENGCPWDLDQTMKTIAPHTIEEAYEVADAIEREDYRDLRDELGDLLLQVVYHAQIAHEQDLFSLDDVARAISDKLVRRHPHVFGDEPVECSRRLREAWEAQKSRERAARSDTGEPSALDGVAHALPALMRAAKLQGRASRVGFDWSETMEIFFKIEEELDELKAEMDEDAGRDRIRDEMGDLLFALVNLARHLELDPEQALRGSNEKFERRFREMERILRDRGRAPGDCDLEEMDELWESVKRAEREARA